MNLTSADLVPMADWIKNPLIFRDHSVSFGFHKDVPGAPDLNEGDTYSGTLTFKEGTVGSAVLGAPEPTLPNRGGTRHSTHSTLHGTGTTPRNEKDEVDITIDLVLLHLSVTFRGSVFRQMASNGPFDKYKESAGFLEFTFQEGSDLYTLYMQQHGTDGQSVKAHHP